MNDQIVLSVETFAALEGDTFSVQLSPEDTLALELIEIKKLGHGERDGGAFSLLWQGASGPILPQATYPVVHDSLGTVELFLVPIGQVEDGIQYEAIFT